MTISKKETLLIVDDIAGNLEIMSNILLPDYDIKVAKSGRKALEIAQTMPLPDLILLDVIMPEMDGLTALKEIKSQFPRVKVLVLSMLNDYIHFEKAKNLGASGFMSKRGRRG
ncbi:MAG: response regulator [Candidatus Riflebacteria bacterium]|nr:response regulator [Candidatus Riflebacteria bacterium]